MAKIKLITKSLLFLFLCSFPFVSIFANGYFKWPESTFKRLDVGIYWAGKGNVYCPANAYKLNALAVCKNAYDPTKPTLLFIHGWEPESVRFLSRFEFYYPISGLDKKYWDLGKIWRAKGWNVGVFYWNQFSDTTYPAQAAAKVWTTKSSQKMYWLQYNSKGSWYHYRDIYKNACHNAKSPFCKPVGELLYKDYVKALQNYHGPAIRIVGHSVGGQLAIYLTHKIADQVDQQKLSLNLLPKQLVLLDPYFSLDNSYLQAVGIDNHALAGKYVNDIAYRYGIVVSEYLSSNLTLPAEWGSIAKTAAVTYYRPWFDWSWREDQKHSASWLIYFLSMKDKPPKTYIQFNSLNHKMTLTELAGMSASTSIYEYNKANKSDPVQGIAAMMGGDYYWDQACGDHGKLCGQYTIDTANDLFLEKQDNIGFLPVPQHILIQNKKEGRAIENGEEMIMRKGEIKHLQANVLPKDAANRFVVWESSDPSIVRVYPGGYLKALTAGIVTISAIVPELSGDSTTQLEQSFKVNVSS